MYPIHVNIVFHTIWERCSFVFCAFGGGLFTSGGGVCPRLTFVLLFQYVCVHVLNVNVL